MIDRRRIPSPPDARTFLDQFRNSTESPRLESFRLLPLYLLSRQNHHEELVIELCRWSDEDLTRFLNGCLISQVPEALALAETVLSRRGISGLEFWLEDQLGDNLRQRWLVDILEEIHEHPATRILIQLLEHPSDSIRKRAADSLACHRGHLDGRAFVRYLAIPLVRQLDRPDPLLAVRALHRIADPALEPDFGRDATRRAERVLIQCVRHEQRGPVRGDAVAALGEIGSRAAVHCLVDMLNRGEQHFHRDVVISLRKIKPEKALIALLGLLQNADPIIREEAANALGEIGDRKAIRRLLELLDDANADVRQEAILALGKLGGKEVLLALEKAMADDDPTVRMTTVCALAESLGKQAQGHLIGALYDSSADVRGEAAYHLGNVGDSTVWPHLEAFLGDPQKDAFGDRVGSIVRKALWRLKTGWKD